MSLYNDLTDVLTPYANKIKEVNETLENNMSGTRNLFDKSKAINRTITIADTYVSGTERWTSDYIPVYAGYSYCFTKCDRSYRCLYDTEKVRIIGGFSVTNPFVPAQDGYIRVCVLTENLDTAQVEESETPTEYVPYKSLVDYVARYQSKDIAHNKANIERNKAIIDQNCADIEELQAGGLDIADAVIGEKVAEWLENHPEATTTINDKSITLSKFADNDLPYVTPELFGAVGDGETDDTESIQNAIDFCMLNNKTLRFSPKTYMVSVSDDRYDITVSRYVQMKYALIIKNGSISIDFNGATLKILDNNVACFDMFLIILSNGVYMKNGTLIGDMDTFINRGGGWDSSKIITLYDSRNVTLDRITMTHSKGDGLGLNGVQDGANMNYAFEDYYMNILVKNCIVSRVYRNGITISRARGVVFDGCLIEECHGTSPELGVDVEPWYAAGNVFDTTFINCFFRGNFSGDIYAQSAHDFRVINCIGEGQCSAGNSEHVSIISSKFDYYSVVGAKCEIKDSIATSTATSVNVVCDSSYDFGGELSVVIENCELHGRVFSRSDALLFESLIVRGCRIWGSNNSPITLSNPTNSFKEIVIENNSMYMSAEGSAGSSGCVRIMNGRNVVIRNNSMYIDSKLMNGSVFGHLSSCENTIIENNNIEYRQDDEEGTYSYPAVELIRLGGGFSAIKGNTLNLNAIAPSSRQTFYALNIESGAGRTVASFENNTLYGVTDKANENIKLLSDKDNMLIMKPSLITNGYRISNGVAVVDETAEIVAYGVTAGNKMRMLLFADFEDGTYQWQNSNSVPSSNNTYIIGTPITGDVNGIIDVPNGASWLMVSRKIGSMSRIAKHESTVTSETWTFTLSDDSTVNKRVVIEP